MTVTTEEIAAIEAAAEAYVPTVPLMTDEQAAYLRALLPIPARRPAADDAPEASP